MGVYERLILPRLIHAAMRAERLHPYRRRVAGEAAGRVLELGVGSALNAAFYSARAGPIIGLDPSAALLTRAQPAMLASRRGDGHRLLLLRGLAEAVPLDRASVDSVVTTWMLCSVPDPRAVLLEVRRVLRPSGRLYFVEHGRSRDERVRRWQDRLTPLWKHLAGCHLNRPVDVLIEECGFAFDHLTTDYMAGPRPLTFTYEGSARPL